MNDLNQLDINPGDWVEVCDIDGSKMLSNRSAKVPILWKTATTKPDAEDVEGMFLAATTSQTLQAGDTAEKLFARVQAGSGALLAYWTFEAPDDDADLVMAQVAQAIDAWRDAPVALDLVYPVIDLGSYKATVIWINAVSFGGINVGINQEDILDIRGVGFFSNGSDSVPNAFVRLGMSGTSFRIIQQSGYNLSRGAAVVIYHR